MKKILSLLLALALACCMLVSCDETAEKIIEKADAALLNTPYEMTMKMNFECDDDELNEYFSMMNMEIPVTVDGKNLAMEMSMEMMGYSADCEIIVADMVMYYNIQMLGQSIKMKATMNESQYNEFIEENGAEPMFKPEDFGKLTVESKDGKKYIACLEIDDEALSELNDIMADSMEAFDAKTSVSDVTYGVTLNDGKYESMDLTCVYSVTVDGETVNVTLNLGVEFSYDNVGKITAPSDADAYESMNFGDLMG